ncbi:MAG: hypothetical protein LBK25_09540 [Treponema sp.]|nr:hypothetical protein [Treponema sp.]
MKSTRKQRWEKGRKAGASPITYKWWKTNNTGLEMSEQSALLATFDVALCNRFFI